MSLGRSEGLRHGDVSPQTLGQSCLNVQTTVACLLALTLQSRHRHPDYVQRIALHVEVKSDSGRRVLRREGDSAAASKKSAEPPREAMDTGIRGWI